jgi:serine/threonine protein kinase
MLEDNDKSNEKTTYDSSTSKPKQTINDFEKIKYLGNGSFADVYLVKNNFTNSLSAIKILDKKHIFKVSLIK